MFVMVVEEEVVKLKKTIILTPSSKTIELWWEMIVKRTIGFIGIKII